MSFRNAQENGKPVAIKDEGLTLTPAVGSIDFSGAGVTGSIIGSDVTETIPGGSGGGGTPITEDVSGTINGSNVTFTLTHTPIAGTLSLRLVRQPQEDPTDYSISGSTITYVIAPDASLSGGPHKTTYQY